MNSVFFCSSSKTWCICSEPNGFLFSIFVRSLFSTNRALRHDTSPYKPIGKIRCVLGHQRLGERFFFFHSLPLSLYFCLSFLSQASDPKKSEQGRKVAATNKLILWSTRQRVWMCLQAYLVVFFSLFLQTFYRYYYYYYHHHHRFRLLVIAKERKRKEATRN